MYVVNYMHAWLMGKTIMLYTIQKLGGICPLPLKVRGAGAP